MSELVDLAYQLFCKASEAEDHGRLDEAARIYETSARMGYSAAQLNLGTLLDDHLQPRQPLKAIYWYGRAYRNGDPSGAWNLAMHYAKRRNKRWFRFWMEKAAERGDEDAIGEMTKLKCDPNYTTVLPFIEQDNDPAYDTDDAE